MFKVIHIATGEPMTVYAVSGSLFLVWNDKECAQHWEWVPMNQFRQVTTDDMAEG